MNTLLLKGNTSHTGRDIYCAFYLLGVSYVLSVLSSQMTEDTKVPPSSPRNSCWFHCKSELASLAKTAERAYGHHLNLMQQMRVDFGI